MTNEWLVPVLVGVVILGIVMFDRRSARPLRRGRPRRLRGKAMIASVEETLGIGILVHDVIRVLRPGSSRPACSMARASA